MSEINPSYHQSSTPQNHQNPQNNNMRSGILIGILIAFVICGGVFSFAYNKLTYPDINMEVAETEETETEEVEDFADDRDPVFTFLDKPKSVKVVDIFNQARDEFDYSAYNYQMKESKAWQFGEIEGGKYNQGKLIRMDVAFEGPVFNPTFVRLIQLPNEEIVVLEKYSSLDFGTDSKKFSLDDQFELPELELPEQLNLGASNKIVHLVPDRPEIFDGKNKKVFYTDSEGRKIYTDKTFGSFWEKNGFYLELVDGSQASYEYKPRFIPENGIPNFTFKNGTPNKLEYTYTSVAGCGSSDFIKLVERSELETTTIVATTSTGSDLYAPTLANPYLNEYYEFYHPAYGEEKPSLQQFVSNYPILFFEDPFGRIAVLTSSLAVPAAECGKPVIYLYPEKTSQISVKVKPVGGFTYTEPNYEKYGEGWNVIATPNSQIFEIEDKTKTTYPYLFWEGRGGIYQAPEVGFMVKRENIDNFLSEKLSYMGFNETEIKDFKEFWLPRMQEFPYYKISLMGNQVMDALAPLEITPKPDTVIRMLMDFKGYEKPIKVTEQRLLRGPERKGFTVTEWGGVIQ